MNLKNEISRDELLAELMKKKRFTPELVDLSDIDNPEAAFQNGNHMMCAASLPKIAVLLTAMKAIASFRKCGFKYVSTISREGQEKESGLSEYDNIIMIITIENSKAGVSLQRKI